MAGEGLFPFGTYDDANLTESSYGTSNLTDLSYGGANLTDSYGGFGGAVAYGGDGDLFLEDFGSSDASWLDSMLSEGTTQPLAAGLFLGHGFVLDGRLKRHRRRL